MDATRVGGLRFASSALRLLSHISTQNLGNGGDLRFRITFSGELKSGGNKSRASDKDAIRRHISPQLAELRITHPVFSAYGLTIVRPPRSSVDGQSTLDRIADEALSHLPTAELVHVSPGHYDIGMAITEYAEVRGRKYVPIVRSSLATTCSLDILFLRKGSAGALLGNRGDLDNRIKVLFDGLRIPKPNEIEPPTSSEIDEITYCLLEDDALITEFSVRSDRLLTHPGGSDSQVLLVIDVEVRVSNLTSNNLGFLGD